MDINEDLLQRFIFFYKNSALLADKSDSGSGDESKIMSNQELAEEFQI